MGPTASGKSDLALALADVLPVEIVSVDAAQVFRGMDVGTAKPNARERAAVPHHLIDIRDPAEAYSAADFCSDALAVMRRISAAGRVPLLVGGTMFYFHALQRGLSALPAADQRVRAALESEAAGRGWPALHAELAAIDPDAAARIASNDAQRIQRALEIYLLSGLPPSQARGRGAGPTPYRYIKLALCPSDRGVLHERIERRFSGMLEAGLVDETRRLLAGRALPAAAPALRTVGYRQVIDYLTNRCDYSEMIGRGVAATRQLAKRQLTWLRRERGVVWVDSTNPRARSAIIDYFASKLNLLRPY
ncbi:MAG: tRNA (adenosine(37)-N6)-dimethylallyltransferase MiaA [Gammaproteobacteria bacterium]|nr:tRNA (adenosine(37)-N6)-dimethylallyltransferase MiaA [Gammaproteobacteria bacterium]MDH3469076.1 tRNA (adenosine(37)-N6)-dimethylallyltransferase MiaA [Gammaproteobacteria bacterium]